MAIFPQSPAKLLAAFGVAALSLSAPAAMAQDNDVRVQSESGYPVLTSEEALEQSNGKVLLHVGEGYSRTALEFDIEALTKAGLTVEIAEGGLTNQITPYFYGNQYPPRSYFSDSSNEMVHTLIAAARQLSLIPNPSTPTSP